MVKSQRDLSRELSKLKLFEDPQFKLEQYETPPHIAADWIWEMAQRSEVAGKTILDAGCGTGILGLGLLLMGARKIYFVEKDESAMKICMENYNTLKKEYEIGEAEFILHDISIFDEQVDVVVQNPPFGTKLEHIDKVFIEKAFSLCKQLIDNIIDTNGMITLLWHVKYMNYNWLTLYEKLLKYLSENDLWVTTPCEVNKWWRERYLLLNK